jgi:hypothetical protein
MFTKYERRFYLGKKIIETRYALDNDLIKRCECYVFELQNPLAQGFGDFSKLAAT